LRPLFETKIEVVAREFRLLYNEIHGLYSSSNTNKGIKRMGRSCSTLSCVKCLQLLILNREGMGPLRTILKSDDWIQLTRDWVG
jgi:hypothetical protein